MDPAARTSCPLCGSTALAGLATPRSGAGMLSDGRTLPRSLERKSCLACGAGFHARPPEAAEVAAWYEKDYGLPQAAPAADAARASGYARWLGAIASHGKPETILDVGAGSGGLLRAFGAALPHARLVGCEPAAATPEPLVEGNLTLYRGDLSSVPAGVHADWVTAVNVIEHVTDPSAFLAAMAQRLAPGGELLVVCPDGTRPGVELMFVDHLTSFTPGAFARAAARAGLHIARSEAAPPDVGDFRIYVLHPAAAQAPSWDGDPKALAESRDAYLRAWQRLDAALQERLAGAPSAVFGAGEMAALLRTYAPLTWEKAERLVLDNPADAWPLGKPVSLPAQAGAATLLLAVAPSKQAKLAGRFEQEGRRTVRFDDLIPR